MTTRSMRSLFLGSPARTWRDFFVQMALVWALWTGVWFLLTLWRDSLGWGYFLLLAGIVTVIAVVNTARNVHQDRQHQ